MCPSKTPESRLNATDLAGSPVAAELNETDLDKVAGGFVGFYINKPASTAPTGIKGESVDNSHKDPIEISS